MMHVAQAGPLAHLVLTSDDVRLAVALGPNGEVYEPEPDASGTWTRRQAFSTASLVEATGRSSTSVMALANGAIYQLAGNGWSAVRLAQKGKAVLSRGARAVAAVGRQLMAIDRLAGGEPAKLAVLPGPALAMGAGGKALVIATARGLMRSESGIGAWKPLARGPQRVTEFIDDRWALVERGIVDLKTGTTTTWPSGFTFGAATPSKQGPLVCGTQRGSGGATSTVSVQVLRLVASKWTAATVDVSPLSAVPNSGSPNANPGAIATVADGSTPRNADVPVGIVADSAGRIAIAFADGRITTLERDVWRTGLARDHVATARPGAGPARSQ